MIFIRQNLLVGIVDSPECVELLLHHGAKVNAQDLKNNTAAMVACFFNKPRILSTLIRAGADLTVRNNEGKEMEMLFEQINVCLSLFRQRCI